jgi:pimeloyl-ACP methyl ester carboxylesterase
LLHGFPEFWYAWKGIIAPLARAGFRVIVPDQRGYGDSDKPRSVDAYRIDRLGDDIAGLIAVLGYEQAFVAAHDWGGAVAWNLAIRHPGRVRRIAVIGTPHPDAQRETPSKDASISWYRTLFRIPRLPEELARWGNWAVLSKILRDTSEPGVFSDDTLDVYRSAWDHDGAFGTMVNWYRAAARTEGSQTAERRVVVPTLLLLTAHDAFIPADRTRASLPLCDDGRLIELGSGTHWVLQEEPERIATLLTEFFNSPSARR